MFAYGPAESFYYRTENFFVKPQYLVHQELANEQIDEIIARLRQSHPQPLIQNSADQVIAQLQALKRFYSDQMQELNLDKHKEAIASHYLNFATSIKKAFDKPEMAKQHLQPWVQDNSLVELGVKVKKQDKVLNTVAVVSSFIALSCAVLALASCAALFVSPGLGVLGASIFFTAMMGASMVALETRCSTSGKSLNLDGSANKRVLDSSRLA